MSLTTALGARTREGVLYTREADDHVVCTACAHTCRIAPGRAGVCRVRLNAEGSLRVPWGYVAGVAPDPIEKKPFFHVLPGTIAFSFGMLGCDLHCSFCQNWLSSQVLRDPEAQAGLADVTSDALVDAALRAGATSVVSTYNEPLITVEWAAEVFRLARAAGLATGIVSNGFATPEVIDFIAPLVDFVKVDLKTFDDRRYRELGGRLQPVLDTIAELHRRGVWVEIVTLIVPGFNDAPTELRALAAFLAGVSTDIPWHVTAFHPAYRHAAAPPTRPSSLMDAARIGVDAGLRYVYAGNASGRVGALEQTTCPSCRAVLVERHGFTARRVTLADDGRCAGCGSTVPGFWTPSGGGVRRRPDA